MTPGTPHSLVATEPTVMLLTLVGSWPAAVAGTICREHHFCVRSAHLSPITGSVAVTGRVLAALSGMQVDLRDW